MKNWKTECKAGKISNCFKITPCLQITYSGIKLETGFAIELTWFNYTTGIRFYF